MSEALPQQQQDADIATMAADLARRRRRLQLLNLAILLLPLAGGAIFLAFGRNDREWVRDEVGASVTETVSSRVEESVQKAVPPAVASVVEETVPPAVKASVRESVLPVVEATVAEAVPRTVQQALTEAPVMRRFEALVAAPSASPEDLAQVKADLEKRLDNQQKELDNHTRQITGLVRSRRDLADLVIDRLKAAEKLLPADLESRLRNLPPPMRERLGDVAQVRKELQQLRLELEQANGE